MKQQTEAKTGNGTLQKTVAKAAMAASADAQFVALQRASPWL